MCFRNRWRCRLRQNNLSFKIAIAESKFLLGLADVPINPPYANKGRNLLPLSSRNFSSAIPTGSNSAPILARYLFSCFINSVSTWFISARITLISPVPEKLTPQRYPACCEQCSKSLFLLLRVLSA